MTKVSLSYILRFGVFIGLIDTDGYIAEPMNRWKDNRLKDNTGRPIIHYWTAP